LIYLGFFNGILYGSGEGAIGTALAVPALALIGGLAVACFVKVIGVVFLGTSRAPVPSPHEAGWFMRIPMIMLSLVCLVIGCFPTAMGPLLQSAVVSALPQTATVPTLATTAPLGWISVLAVALLALSLLTWLWYRRRLRHAPVASAATWGCGYLAPTSRMQYSASSFADMLVRLFVGILRPERHAPTIKGAFPGRPHFASHVPETVLERVYLPFLAWAYSKVLPIRNLQHGQIHLYILYTFITLVLLLVVSSS
jgi:hydrogenase-4 component B